MLNRSASLAMSTCILKALPGKLDIKRHSPSIFFDFVFSMKDYYVCINFMESRSNILASTRENLSLGLPTNRDSNKSTQLQRLARKLKFHL